MAFKGRIWRIPDTEFKEIVSTSSSGSEIMKRLGFKQFSGESGKGLKRRCAALGIELPNGHKNRKAVLVKSKEGIELTYDTVCQNNSGHTRRTVRRHYERKHPICCVKCGNDGSWLNERLVIQLDHEDGDSNNNHPSNLRWLCPNCHSQTKTYGRKKRFCE